MLRPFVYARVQGGAYTFSDGTSNIHADYFSGWDEAELQKVLDECQNDGEAGMPHLWCENHLSFRDVPKLDPEAEDGPRGSDELIVEKLKSIQPYPPLDPQVTVTAEKITGVTKIPSGACSAPLIPADPKRDWRCTRNCTHLGSRAGDRGGSCVGGDNCDENNKCHSQATCTHTIDTYRCTCKAGYVGDGKTCAHAGIH